MGRTIFVFGVGFVICWMTIGSYSDPMDIVMLLDSSDRYRSDNFDKEKAFADALTDRLFNQENKIGLFTYGSRTHEQFSLNAYTDLQQMKDAITLMWFSTGNGTLDSAINFTISTGFSSVRGNRECIVNILIILTHTSVSDIQSSTRLAKNLDEKAIRTFVISMSKNPKEDDLIKITNDTSRVIKIPTFAALQHAIDPIVQKIKSDLPRTGCGVLSQWEQWTKCSRSCNSGLYLRIRKCNKVSETDKVCAGDLTEDRACNLGRCQEPLDGGWANWGKWTACSKTCEKGSQTRTRTCDEPIPYNGGKQCPGKNVQLRECADWTCPDCAKTCPAGGHLSKDCEVCECSSITLFGRIMDNLKAPVKDAEIYLESRRYKPIATTNELGYFNASGICIMNENVHVLSSGHDSLDVTPKETNSSHWTFNATLLKFIAPLFSKQPHSKIRMIGQSMSLCCEAVGTPVPLAYKWFKNGIELENIGTNGTLIFTSIKQTDEATYRCTVETQAGLSLSENAKVTVKAANTDTCSAPRPRLHLLSQSCYVSGDAARNNSLNVGTCDKSECMMSSLRDKGTCSDWWPHHCCDVDQVERVDIACDGYTYTTTKVKSCKCTLCVLKTTITGRAFGRKDGQTMPFKLGEITFNGQSMGRSNMAGYFRFEVRKGIKRVVVTFHDDIFKNFIDITKIVQVNEGFETSVSIAIPLKPTPIPFHPRDGTNVQIGDGTDGIPPAGSISIPENSLLTADGHPYDGPAKALVHFMDPRKRDDIEAANGDFVSESPGGEKLPLRTFGMFQVRAEDDSGNVLQIHKPLTFNLDASLFNITLDKNGNPDLALWYYDTNKGIWVEQSKLQFSSHTDGRRRLLAAQLTGTVPPINLLKMNPYKNHTEVGVIGYTNCDQSVPIYGNVSVIDPNPREGACVVSVSVYEDFTLTEPTKEGSVTVTAFSQELDGSVYLATMSDTIDNHGHVCLSVFCDKNVYIYARKGKTRLLPAKHFLPCGYPVISSPNEHEVKFESRNFGDAYDCSGDNRKPVCRGPMFSYADSNVCYNSHSDNSFRFKFAPFTKNAALHPITGSTNKFDEKLSWYPVSPEKKTFRSCFIKATIKVDGTYDMRISATSYLHSFPGDQFGTYDVGPEPDPDSLNTRDRAACIEFRCAGYINDGITEYFNKSTVVQALIISQSNKALRCSLRYIFWGQKGQFTGKTSHSNVNPADVTGALTIGPRTTLHPTLNITQVANGYNGFQFTAEAGKNYGSSYGVYVNDEDSSTVQDYCASGTDSDPNIDGIMKPTKNAAIEINCL